VNASRLLASAWRSLTRSKLRSFLMMLGVIVGIASLTALASVGEATRQETMRQFKRMLGTFDTLTIRPGAGSTRGMPSLGAVEPSLKFDDGPAIVAGVRGVKRVALVQQAFDLDVSYRDETAVPLVLGVSPNWADVRGEAVASGEHLSDDDDRTLARVAVIGSDVAQTLFHGEEPLGKVIRIADVPFQVKGVMAPRGAGPGGVSLDNMLVIPVSTSAKRLFNRDYLTTLVVQLEDANESDRVADDVRAVLRERHRIIPPAEDDFTVSSPRATLAQITSVGTMLSKVVTGVAVIATLIGGAVIMSLMLIGVSERRREIGLRRAIGATRRDVLRQFLVEAALIAVVGGAIGIVVGAGGATIGALLQKLPPAYEWQIIGAAFAISLAVGILFGLYPAWKAANVDPIEALRS
jgi:putative ABC transport system permease protein